MGSFSSLVRELRARLPLAGPVVAAQLAHISMSFVDAVMVGRLGPEALAGVALGHTAFFFLVAMGVAGVFMGLTALCFLFFPPHRGVVSGSLGAGER